MNSLAFWFEARTGPHCREAALNRRWWSHWTEEVEVEILRLLKQLEFAEYWKRWSCANEGIVRSLCVGQAWLFGWGLGCTCATWDSARPTGDGLPCSCKQNKDTRGHTVQKDCAQAQLERRDLSELVTHHLRPQLSCALGVRSLALD